MNPWVETVLIVLLSATMFAVGYRFERARWLWMGLGILGIATGLFAPVLFRGREYGLIMSVSIPLMTAPVFRFPLSRTLAVGLFTATLLCTGGKGWVEFFTPALSRAELSKLTTSFRGDVCIQSTGYTCGPAAAVTFLRRLGISAEEGELALLAKCSQQTGTDGPLLADAMETRFPELRCTVVDFKDLDALTRAGEVLTVVNLDEVTDHWILVLKVTDTTVETADPIYGLHTESRSQFEKRWRFESITVTRR